MSNEFNSCFISYKHPVEMNSRETVLIQHVYRAITDHIQLYTHAPVFFDASRLMPGYVWRSALSLELCRSACMVVVYWPSYLESDYCKKEISTMVAIEKNRRKILGDRLSARRLIIPVILRGRHDQLPPILQGVQHLDYSAQASRPDFNIGDDNEMSKKLFEIADYIHSLCAIMREEGEGLFGECKKFTMHDVKRDDPRFMMETQKFPGR